MSPSPQNVADTLQFRHLRNTALDFVTATAPSSTEPQYVDGFNCLTSYKGYTELRPGYANSWEITPTNFSGTIKRVFTWRRWGGTFFIMLNEVTATQSKVYKLALGADNSFVNIFNSASVEPFDFIVSNNFCFFGNGADMQKFDGVQTTNWGIAIGSIISPVGPTITGNGTDVSTPGGVAWANPNNVTSSTLFATVTTSTLSHYIFCTQFGFSIPIGNTVVGISVTFDAKSTATSANTAIFAQIIKAGVITGVSLSQRTTTATTTYTLGSSSYPWNNFSPNDVNQSNFGVSLFASTDVPGNTFSIKNVKITIFAITGPPVSVSGSAGTFSAANGGYQYVYAYSNGNTGHVSSPTPASAATGNFTNKLNVGITVLASSDPQVTNIRLFRTTDGGGGQFFEVQGSPYPNANATVTDSTADANLSIITAPTFGFNDPPPSQKGFVWFANRIWGFNNATVYFTDWEELNIGVAEESSVSGPAGNFWNFDSEITGLSLAQDGVIIFTAGSIYKIDGDSLDTFRRTVIAHGIGCRNRSCIARLGGMTAFLANTNSVWTTDSNSLQELSQWIQPTIDGINQSQASMTFHLQGQNRWLLLADPSHNQTLSYDINEQQWMTPWTIVPTACFSGETSPGNFELLIGAAPNGNTRMLQMTPSAYRDDGLAYGAQLNTNLIPIVSEHLSTGNQILDLYYPQEPGHIAYVEYIGMETNTVLPSDVAFLLDDDPEISSYTSVFANQVNPKLRTSGTNLLEKWYYVRKPEGKRCSIQITWAATATNFKFYTLTMAYRITA